MAKKKPSKPAAADPKPPPPPPPPPPAARAGVSPAHFLGAMAVLLAVCIAYLGHVMSAAMADTRSAVEAFAETNAQMLAEADARAAPTRAAAAAAAAPCSASNRGQCEALAYKLSPSLHARAARGDYNVTLGVLEPGAGAPPSDLDELRAARPDLDYVTHILGPSARGVKQPALAAKFRNFKRRKLEKRWDDGTPEGVYNGHVNANGVSATTSYVGHSFRFTDPSTRQQVAYMTLEAGKNLCVASSTREPASARAHPPSLAPAAGTSSSPTRATRKCSLRRRTSRPRRKRLL